MLYRVSFYIEVHDAAALAQAATAQAAREGTSANDWQELRETNYSEVAADLQMVLDLGSPPGCDIRDVECDELSP